MTGGGTAATVMTRVAGPARAATCSPVRTAPATGGRNTLGARLTGQFVFLTISRIRPPGRGTAEPAGQPVVASGDVTAGPALSWARSVTGSSTARTAVMNSTAPAVATTSSSVESARTASLPGYTEIYYVATFCTINALLYYWHINFMICH